MFVLNNFGIDREGIPWADHADDIILLSKSKSGLQKSLDACCTYFNKWKLEINTNKTKIFNQTKALNGEFYYGKQQIKVVTEYKYLGLIINSTGSFKSAVSELLIKAKRAYACLYQSLNIFNGAKPRTIMKAFDTIVTPIMLYGSEIWTSYTFGHSLKYILGHTKSNMEKFHTRVCKIWHIGIYGILGKIRTIKGKYAQIRVMKPKYSQI